MQPIQGMPYVPGIARGVLRRQPCEGGIWLATQSELSALGSVRPAGAVVIDAAPFSHAMIALLARGVPTVLLESVQADLLGEGDEVLLDGAGGRIFPADAPTSFLTPVPPTPPGKPVLTVDHVAVEFRASVRDVEGAHHARAQGAAAIGLVRTEFLLPADGAAPDFGFYHQTLGAICQAAEPLPVVVRLLDIAPDKHPAWVGDRLARGGALGLQGMALFDREPVASAVLAQLGAMRRLQQHHALRLLLPYVRNVDEFDRGREMINSRLAKPLLVGAMLETPAAALAIAEFGEAADFVALGTNDLMQCLFGADRDRPEVARFLDPYAPALYRFLRAVAESAGPQLIRAQVCGLLAQQPGCLELMLGLGFRIFSVDAAFIPYLAHITARTTITYARDLVDAVCASASSREAMALLERFQARGQATRA